ncbi:hypothetical protein D047_0084B, partial [Vibrio parahaemolyticus VPTS-2010_2]
ADTVNDAFFSVWKFSICLMSIL